MIWCCSLGAARSVAGTSNSWNVTLSDLPDGWHAIAGQPQVDRQDDDDQLTACMGLTVGRPGGKTRGAQLVDRTGTHLVTSTALQSSVRRALDVERARRRSKYPRCLAESLQRTAAAAGAVIPSVTTARVRTQGANPWNGVRLTYVAPVNGTDTTVYLERYALKHGRTTLDVSFVSNRGVPGARLEQSVLDHVQRRNRSERA
jgi:hypothetical protein